MASPKEVEIKVQVDDLRAVEEKLRAAGFREVTPSTHEINTMYDTRTRELRNRGEVLRLRDYGGKWKLTHKSRDLKQDGKAVKHKTRVESETGVADAKATDAILRALGYEPSFVYEKYRAEWTDGKGHVVLDRTPIGNIVEIEGPARWIDATAKKLGVDRKHYVTKSYGEMFYDWKRETQSAAENMTFKEIRKRA